MPPKKITTESTANNCVAFGRVRSNLKMGCVGLPNVGKSSLFNLMTEQNAAAEDYPSCTIEPNEARCVVPDPRYVSTILNPALLVSSRHVMMGGEIESEVTDKNRTSSAKSGTHRHSTQHSCR